MTRHLMAATVLTLAVATAAGAEVKTRVVDYKQGDTELQGLIAWDDAANGARPGVLVVHEWWGHNEHARNAARKLAAAGYVAFALDMYGKGKLATHPDDAMKFMTEATKDPAVVAARFEAALAELKKDPHVDGTRIGAIGYCFGGGVVLNMARGGAALKGVVTFHGSLAPVMTAKKGGVTAKILVQTGADDPMIPAAQVDAFKKEMLDAGADVQVIVYPGAKHSFTNPDADKAGMPQLAYNADADAKSWAAMLDFFKKTL